ncbi:MAG: tetratricopeptide repeat protein [Cyclobacteriaceae bacterium]
MRLIAPFLILCVALISGCIKTESSQGSDQVINKVIEQPAPQNDPNQVVSLLGELLPPKKLSSSVRKIRLAQMAKARTKYETYPDSIENIIWYGRRLAYLGQYKDAIRIYSVGLDIKPDSYRLLRHRGHRYITIREFDLAIEDLQKAVFYARTAENQIEPDGLPNRKNIPLSNDKFNIWYHLGIAYYLKGNYDKALSSFKHCLDYVDNDDLLVANTDWYYMTYQKIGNTEAAKELLESVDKRMRIIENYHYNRRIQLYLGKTDPIDILDQAQGDNGSLDPTLGYGLANWYLYNGQLEQAKSTLNRVLKHHAWDAFGYIAAEVDQVTISSLEN